jgi:medium-chain acyl-[acyl-carrier-protein] hydrolase
MKQALWSQSYNINTFLVNPEKKLGLYGLLNLIQDTAWIHATHLGHGYESMIQEQTAWVLTRQKLAMDSWPNWGDDIELKTWIRPITGLVAIRDFEISTKDKKIGECTTQWLILDLKTRRPAEKLLNLTPDKFKGDAVTTIEAAKVPLVSTGIELAHFHVRNSDLDLNGHVNNTKYAQWILDSIPYDRHQAHSVKEYEVNFIAETKSGDEIKIFSSKLSDDRFQFQGQRLSDKKICFAATLKVSAQQLSPANNLSQ